MTTKVRRGDLTSRAVELYVMSCSNCGITFGVPNDWDDARRQDGLTFYCPNGHHQCYRKTEVDLLRERLANTQAYRDSLSAMLTHETDQRKAAERSAAALRGVVTRTKNRAQAGQCIACSRRFPNLTAHMAAMHPHHADTDPLTEPDDGEATS